MKVTKKKCRLYCVSGLGADHRVFTYIHSNKYELIVIPWIVPNINESILDYAKRLVIANSIPDGSNILGVSFGGVVGIEIAKIIKARKLFLVSSIVDDIEIPRILKISGKIQLFKRLPNFLMSPPDFISFYLFGIRNKKHKRLLSQIIKETDKQFLKWALQSLSEWKQTDKIDCIRIHGLKDRLFRCRDTSLFHFTLNEGGHFIIITHALEISSFLDNDAQ